MKLSLFLTGIAVAMLATSCANDSIIKQEPVAPAEETPMTFGARSGNTSRAATVGLESSCANFGVFAYKGTNPNGATLNDETVMNNYLVGYRGESDPMSIVTYYAPLAGSDEGWYYENLGYSQYSYEATEEPSPYLTESISDNENQYLKYWDPNSAYTYFYAYASYGNDGNAPTLTLNENSQPVMTFNTIFSGNEQESMYAAAIVPKSKYSEPVELQFTRLTCVLEIGFYETIAGYSIRLTDVKALNADGTVSDQYYYEVDDVDATNSTVVAVPAIVKGDGYTKEGASYLQSGELVVTFEGAEGKASFNNVTSGNRNMYFANLLESTRKIKGENVTAGWVGESKDSYVLSSRAKYLMPANNNGNCGFVFVISYDLVAEDTGEVIHIDNAATWVAPEYTNWEANTLYRYIFRINPTSPKEPSDPSVPTVPDYDDLNAIQFVALQKTDYEEGGTEYFDIEGGETPAD